MAGTLAVRLMPRDSEITISDLMFSLDGSQMDFFFLKGWLIKMNFSQCKCTYVYEYDSSNLFAFHVRMKLNV